MSDHSDLIAELRALADCDSRAGEPLGKCMRRAADKIERLAEHVDYIEAQWLAKDAALSSQSLSLSEAREEIERLKKLSDRYGVALMMIRAGCSDPARFAGNILDDRQPVNVELDEEDFDENHR